MILNDGYFFHIFHANQSNQFSAIFVTTPQAQRLPTLNHQSNQASKPNPPNNQPTQHLTHPTTNPLTQQPIHSPNNQSTHSLNNHPTNPPQRRLDLSDHHTYRSLQSRVQVPSNASLGHQQRAGLFQGGTSQPCLCFYLLIHKFKRLVTFVNSLIQYLF